jgi:hypothetical protein
MIRCVLLFCIVLNTCAIANKKPAEINFPTIKEMFELPKCHLNMGDLEKLKL